MNYRLIDHDRGNAVQDLLICLLPEEEHRRVDVEVGDLCTSVLETGPDGLLTARAFVTRGGRPSAGYHSEMPAGTGRIEVNRAASYAVKTALYHAMVPHLEELPPWGSLTGVKPAKVVRDLLASGAAPSAAMSHLTDRYFVEDARARLCVIAAQHAIAAEAALAPREIQLYAGIPFCPAKCAYCSFVSNDTQKSGHLIAPYLEALLAEIAASGLMVRQQGLTLGSLYLGGGTPTILTASQLDTLLGALHDAFDLSTCREITVEGGRPETLDMEKLRVLAHRGVTRLSINPQTMDDAVLCGVGRHHTADDIIRAFREARGLGAFAINMDLIAGLPGDSDEGLMRSVQQLIALAPDNITLHCLARKKGAALRFGKQGRLPAATMDACYAALQQAGYGPYYLYRQKYSAGGLENIGWAKAGFASHYNICMMEELCDVLALGAGGVTKLGTRNGGVIRRVQNPKYPREYIVNSGEIAAQKSQLSL